MVILISCIIKGRKNWQLVAFPIVHLKHFSFDDFSERFVLTQHEIVKAYLIWKLVKEV